MLLLHIKIQKCSAYVWSFCHVRFTISENGEEAGIQTLGFIKAFASLPRKTLSNPFEYRHFTGKVHKKKLVTDIIICYLKKCQYVF